jgi:hypothetical protein
MTTNYPDDDENVKMMRETARAIGLTKMLIDARDGNLDAHDAVRQALEMLGERSGVVAAEGEHS